MELTTQQLQVAESGEAVTIEADGKSLVLLSRAEYEDDLDFSPWSRQEMDSLADEAMQFVSGDELDEEDQA